MSQEKSKTPLPKGFKISTASAGFKTPGRRDMALVLSEVPAAAAGVFTTNLFKAAPVLVAQENLRVGSKASAILINTGQANACTGDEGLANCRKTLELAGKALGLQPSAILPGSTGVIGAQLKMELWEKALPELAGNLGRMSVEDFAEAIMTTDRFPKYAGQVLNLSGGTVTLVGMAKGAGMICPNMATMLAVLLCDAAVPIAEWQTMLGHAADLSFNRVTVDGDTSTNDSIFALANGASGVQPAGADLELLQKAVQDILWQLGYMLVQDGEGATKVIHISVSGAADDSAAEQAARTVGHSQLVKTAMYGKDANWGRIVAALGRSGVMFNPGEVSVDLCGVSIFKNGQPTSSGSDVEFEAKLTALLQERDIKMNISLGKGAGQYVLLASDLTHDYISLNADYRS